MIGHLRRRIGTAVQRAVLEITDVVIEVPEINDAPRPEMGDLAAPVALQLARGLGRNPRQLADELVGWLADHPVEGVRGWEVAGPGFLNIQLDRGAALRELLTSLVVLKKDTAPAAPEASPSGDLAAGKERSGVPGKVLIEHTSINPNKAAHIGHLRNACLGDSVARLLRHPGHLAELIGQVEVHNYIDDTGVQVADVVIGLIDERGLDAASIAAIPEPFDYYCWDVYTEVGQELADAPDFAERRRHVLHALENRTGIEAAVAAVVVERIVSCHLRTMGRLGIEYDLLVGEGDILTLNLWEEAFDKLQASGALYYAESGKHEGCWMMRLSGTDGFEDLEEADKVLVRSNGVATYVAKDIAYHMWKYGLLDRDFKYREVSGYPGVWKTTAAEGESRDYGRADRAITVIDVRQSYLQAIVAQSLKLFGDGGAFTHLDYEMVTLSPNTATALGIEVNSQVPEADTSDTGEDSESGKPRFVEMSGRRGHGVKADDLLDELEHRATHEVAARNPELTEGEHQAIGQQVAVAAARYFLLKYTRNALIVFDLDEALSFEGESGPYIQYATVRADRIFDRLRARFGARWSVSDALRGGDEIGETDEIERAPATSINSGFCRRLDEESSDVWQLVLALGRLDEILEQTRRTLEISSLAKYGFSLAQQFSRFYHGQSVLQEEDLDLRRLRAAITAAARVQLGVVLEVLGIEVPARM